MDEPLNTDTEGNELAVADVLGTDKDYMMAGIETEDENKTLRDILSDLPAREKEIVDLRYGFISGKEMTQKEVADKLNISQSYISRIEKKILSKLKREIAKLA